MNDRDREAFGSAMAGLAETFGRSLTDEMLEIYFHALESLTIDQFRRIAWDLARELEFFPKPRDFLQKLTGGNEIVAANDAWAAVLEHVRKGRYRSGAGIDDLTDAVVRAIGGYGVIGRSSEDELHFVERRFREAFDGYWSAASVNARLTHRSQAPTLSESLRLASAKAMPQ